MGALNDVRFARKVKANMHWCIGGSWWINGGAPLRAIPHLFRAVWTDPTILLRRALRGRKRNT